MKIIPINGVDRRIEYAERDTDPEITKDYVRPRMSPRGLFGRFRLWVGLLLVKLGTRLIP